MQKTFKIITLQALAFMALLFVLFLTLRLVFIAFFQEAVNEVSLSEFGLFFVNAFRYDGQIIGVLSVFFFFFNFIRSEKLLKIYAFLVIFITAFVSMANIGFYGIYQDVFNATLLGLFFDDKKAMFETALQGDFHFTSKIVLWLVMSVIFYAFFVFLQRKIALIQTKSFRVSLFVIFALCCLFSINGQIGLKGISLGKEIVPVTNAFLRKISHGAFRDLRYVYMSYAKIANSSFKDYTNESPIQAAKAFFKFESEKNEFDLSKLLEKEVSNPSKSQIQHIFYIIAESFSGWHFDDELKALGINELNSLLKEPNAFKADIFLQNADGTIKSLDVQISGLFQTEIPLNLSVGKNPVFKTSPGFIFKDLGFETLFYYGGSATWYKLDSYTASQGFDEIKFSNHIVSFAKEKGFKAPFENAWGAFDHYLYEFITENSIKNKDKKSFSMIMTTSNHAPWDTPIEYFDINYEKIDEFVKNHPQFPQNEQMRRILAHIVYQDKMLATFIKKTSKALPNSLFIITGDHYDRYYPYAHIPTLTRNSVPLIIYAPNLNFTVLSKIGSHIDIVPSITELVAFNGYKYASFGSPLVSNDKKKALKNHYAFGYKSVANERFIYDNEKIEYFKGSKAKEGDENLAKALFDDLNRAKALSWWIFNKGYIIKE